MRSRRFPRATRHLPSFRPPNKHPGHDSAPPTSSLVHAVCAASPESVPADRRATGHLPSFRPPNMHPEERIARFGCAADMIPMDESRKNASAGTNPWLRRRPCSVGRDAFGRGGRVGRGGRICATRGWISVDRGSKATLPLTMPRRVFKSSAKDSARRPPGISLQGGPAACKPHGSRPSTCALGGALGAPTVGREAVGERGRRFSSLDSDLEAFSHNPAHGSFAPLAFQPSAMTNCVNQRFLSY